MSNMRKPGRAPLYFVNSSNGIVPSDPNTLRDMGRVRNCVYQLDDATEEIARNVHWRDILAGDAEIERTTNMQTSMMHKTASSGGFYKGSLRNGDSQHRDHHRGSHSKQAEDQFRKSHSTKLFHPASPADTRSEVGSSKHSYRQYSGK